MSHILSVYMFRTIERQAGRTSNVPEGQIACATAGACWNPVTKALPMVVAASVTAPAASAAAPISGKPMNARPAERAVSMSSKIRLVLFLGSTSVTIDWMMRLACVVAYWTAVYQSLNSVAMAAVQRLLVRDGLEVIHQINSTH